MKQAVAPKSRISSIDAIRGFALLGILSLHCMEHFDLMTTPEWISPFWKMIDNVVVEVIYFLFAGKAYAIFSLLFGLGFFMQMDSQSAKGVDFRMRFLWRLAILFVLGYLNGLVYMGDFFTVYAIWGILLIPLSKVSNKWLIGLGALLFLQIPDLINLTLLLNGNVPNEPTRAVTLMNKLYQEAAIVYTDGSFRDVLHFNTWKGQFAKLLWIFNNARYLQLTGLFIAGMLIGRYGIHKSEENMVKYSRKALPYCTAWFVIFYTIALLLPKMGIEEFALQLGVKIFKSYSNLGLMMFYICGLTLLYYKTSARKGLDKMVPVGRMSVTNYMTQSVVGVSLFYGFGANLALQLSFLQCLLLGLTIYGIQMVYCNWWIKRFYYGPVEWLWRVLAWFKPVSFRRK